MIRVHRIGTVSCLVMALSSGMAVAQSTNHEVVERSVAVSYAELDLSKSSGVTELYGRLQRAAEKVCGLDSRSANSLSSHVNIKTRRGKQECYKDALSKAVAQLDLPLLNEQHSSQS